MFSLYPTTNLPPDFQISVMPFSMSYASEADLIARAAAGDARAVQTLVNAHMPRVYALARRTLSQDQEAEDVTQEAFLRAWKALPDWEPRAKFSTWLHRVTLNLCRDRLRKKRETIMDEPPDVVDTALRPDQQLARQQTETALQLAINQLPERQREAITLCSLQELSNIEAAEIMDISVEAMESLLSRARRGLRAALKTREDLKP